MRPLPSACIAVYAQEMCCVIISNVEVDPASLLVLPLQIVFSMMRSVFVLQFWAACYKLTQSVFKMGFVLAKSVG